MNMTTASNEQPQEAVFSKKVLEMLTVANEFCLFLEKAVEYPKESVLAFLQKICPLIYLKAALLPDIAVPNDEAAEHFVREEEWEGILNTLMAKFGEDDLFHYLDHHEKSHTDAIRASLAETFADIYQDLKDFVILYQKPLKASMEYAVYDCKRLFETRFGYLLVNAQQIIHYMLYKDSITGETQDFWNE
jgi:hypothetical protein